MDSVVVCVPDDYEWANDLAEQLDVAGYKIYLEPLESTAAIRQQTAQAMRTARSMIVVVTPESSLGKSADTFEAWWRPFETHGRTIIPCLPPTAPKGAKNWMPYELYQHTPIDFADTAAFSGLVQRLGKPKSPTMQQPPSVVLSPLPTDSPQPTIDPEPTAPPPPPDLPANYPNVPDLVMEKPQMGFLNYVFSVFAGFILVGLIWAAALQSNTSPSTWLGGIGIVFGALFILGRISLNHRQERQWLEQRWQRATQLAISQEKPLVYIEILESPIKHESPSIWDYYGDSLTFGSDHDATIPLWQHKSLEEIAGIIYYNNGRYILENRRLTQALIVVGQPLTPSEAMVIHNGDLIALPDESLMLQFRIADSAS